MVNETLTKKGECSDTPFFVCFVVNKFIQNYAISAPLIAWFNENTSTDYNEINDEKKGTV